MNEKMTSALLSGIRSVELGQLQRPSPKPGEILLKVKVCSVCGSDIRTYNYGNDRIKYPAVIGHEMSGEVVEVGNGVDTFRIKDRICVGADIPSMEDDWSKNGMGNLSDINYAIGYQFPGGYSEYCLLNELTVKFGPVAKIPESVNYEEASLTEPLACCVNGLERAFMEPGKSVLVIGGGPIGVLLYRAASAFGAGIGAITDNDQKRVNRIKAMAIENVYNTKDTALEELMKNLTKGKGFDIVFTACSSPEAQEEAVKVVSKRGVVNFFGGLSSGSRNIQISSNDIHYKEAYITGSHGSSPRQFKLALQLISNGRINVKDIISHRFALKEIEKAFQIAESRVGLKVAVIP